MTVTFLRDGHQIEMEDGEELNSYSLKFDIPLIFEWKAGQFWLHSNREKENPIGIEVDRELERHMAFFKKNSLQRELLAKAIGIKPGKRPKVLDLTAGMLGDSLLFLSMGCEVIAVERNPVAAFLISQALANSRHPRIGSLTFKKGEAREVMKEMPDVDVIFFDPMFEDINEKASPKKEMRIFREVVGEDADSEDIFRIAMEKQIDRVVVKRPRLSRYLVQKPPLEFLGKATRYDVYFPKTMAQLNQIP
jgi:hypothetical protein